MINRENSCDDKISYMTRKKAKEAARKTTRQYHLHTYFCDFCGNWHNGRPEGWRNTKRGKRFVDSHTVLDLPENYIPT